MPAERKTINIPYDDFLEMQRKVDELCKIQEGGTIVTYTHVYGLGSYESKRITCFGENDVLSQIKPHIEKLNKCLVKEQKRNEALRIELEKIKTLLKNSCWLGWVFNYRKILAACMTTVKLEENDTKRNSKAD